MEYEQLPLRVWTVNEDTDINRCFELQIEAILRTIRKGVTIKGEL